MAIGKHYMLNNQETDRSGVNEMIDEMMESDINIAKRDMLVTDNGYRAPSFSE